jgi:GAF domain-containing protein
MSIKRKYVTTLREIENIINSNNFDNKSKIKEVLKILRKNFAKYNWIGIYLLQGDKLVLYEYDGDKETQHKIIPLDKGLCGLAAREKRIVNVSDVSLNPFYLECFPETKSELIVPIFKNGEIIGEIDIDSYKLNAFDSNDEWFITKVANIIVKLYTFI